MSMQPLPNIIICIAISQNSSKDNGATTMSTIKKKSQKIKRSDTLLTKEIFAEAKRFSVHVIDDNLADVVG